MFIPAYAGTELWYAPGDTLNVLAISGLNLREKADINGKPIVKVPYAGMLTVLKDTAKPVVFSFDNIDGHWVYAEYEGKKGYIFDGYLSKLPAPQSDAGEIDLPSLMQNYLQNNLSPVSDPVFEDNENDGGKWEKVREEWEGGITSVVESTIDYTVDDPLPKIHAVYTFSGKYRLEEVFHLMKLIGYFYNTETLMFPLKSSKASENKSGFSFTVSANSILMKSAETAIKLAKENSSIVLTVDGIGIE
ncbi:MAG: SH3 domain-containing protein [Brevinematales bacterium]|nr:SH3 domain-containing protein [Brevinematales bacterium]